MKSILQINLQWRVRMNSQIQLTKYPFKTGKLERKEVVLYLNGEIDNGT